MGFYAKYFLPRRVVAGLLCLMAAGVASMRKFGPPRGHVYAGLTHH